MAQDEEQGDFHLGTALSELFEALISRDLESPDDVDGLMTDDSTAEN